MCVGCGRVAQVWIAQQHHRCTLHKCSKHTCVAICFIQQIWNSCSNICLPQTRLFLCLLSSPDAAAVKCKKKKKAYAAVLCALCKFQSDLLPLTFPGHSCNVLTQHVMRSTEGEWWRLKKRSLRLKTVCVIALFHCSLQTPVNQWTLGRHIDWRAI